MICLVDCNCFYVSCERVFQPFLNGKAVIVLSNNDGCVISRSDEAKKLGIKMGQPFFQIQGLCLQKSIYVFSSNYPLYADLSNRTMDVLNSLCTRNEVYSIDESFLDLRGIDNLTEHGYKIKSIINKFIGIPVSIGIGNTKVLAKFANFLAKKYTFLNGVCNLIDLEEDRINKAMKITNVSEVWGIGLKTAHKLKSLKIYTVYDLKIADAKYLKKILNVNIERIVYELNGITCINIECYKDPSQQILSSRSFKTSINDFNEILSSIYHHIENACDKLRKQNLLCKEVTVFFCSDKFKDDYLTISEKIVFPCYIDSFRNMAGYILPIVKKIFNPLVKYKKCGVLLSVLTKKSDISWDLFNQANIGEDKLLVTLEKINVKYGKGSITIATKKLGVEWKTQDKYISKHFTTNINDIIVVS